MPQNLKSVEIFSVGTWNGMKFVPEDLVDIAANTNALLKSGRHKPPLKLGHSSEQILDQDDGQPALGWLENFKVEGDKLLADMVNVPDVLIEAISGELFKQVSVEMRNVEEFGWIVTATAILGADLPAVKTLEDLQTYLPDGVRADLSDIIAGLNFTVASPTFAGKTNKPEDVDMPDTKELDALKLQFAELEKSNLKMTQDLKDRETSLASMEKDRKAAMFKAAVATSLAPFEKLVTEGKMTPALRDEIEKDFSSQDANFTDGSKLTVSAELLARISAGEGIQFKEVSPDTDTDTDTDDLVDPDVTFADKINETMLEKDFSYDKSFRLVSAKHPDLLRQYIAQPFHDMPDTRPVGR